MPRRARKHGSLGIYHVVCRGIGKQILFEEEADFRYYLRLLKEAKEMYPCEIYAYCLMDNHIHLLLRTDNNELSSFFQSLGTKFVRWYNSKYSRSGHLFQDRFYSSVIESEKAFLSAIVYIHNNPVKANMCRYASDYRWSSIGAFYGANNPLVNVSFSYNIAGTKDSLLQFFAKENGSADDTLFKNDHLGVNHFLTDEKALEVFRSVSHLKSTSDVSSLGKVQRNRYVRALRTNGLTIRQIARIMDISETTVKRICKVAL